jgi:hypothetical protein
MATKIDQKTLTISGGFPQPSTAHQHGAGVMLSNCDHPLCLSLRSANVEPTPEETLEIGRERDTRLLLLAHAAEVLRYREALGRTMWNRDGERRWCAVKRGQQHQADCGYAIADRPAPTTDEMRGLIEAFEKYAEHSEGCHYNPLKPGYCNCGRDAALAKLRGAK